MTLRRLLEAVLPAVVRFTCAGKSPECGPGSVFDDEGRGREPRVPHACARERGGASRVVSRRVT